MPQLPEPDPLGHLVEILSTGEVKPRFSEEGEFITDGWLAAQIGMRVSTIRSQRFKRRHGMPHWLDLDPVMIGAKPRYRRSEALAWLQGQPREYTIEA